MQRCKTGKHLMTGGRLAALVLALAAWAASGCDEPPRPPNREAPPPATAPIRPPTGLSQIPPRQPTPLFPGYAAGRVFTTDGALLHQPGVRVEVEIRGILRDTSQQVAVTTDVKPDGTYFKALEPGLYYQPSARVEFSFAGNNYRLPLVPLYGPYGEPTLAPTNPTTRYLYRACGLRISMPAETRGDRLTRPAPLTGSNVQDHLTGVSQDFVWRLSGPRPGVTYDEDKPESWIGGSVNADFMSFRQDIRRNVDLAPPGTRVFFILTPVGPMADGLPGKPIVVERRYEPAGTMLYHPLIYDIPLERFEVTGFELYPDGKRNALLFPHEDNKWYPSMKYVFTADLEKSMLEPRRFWFTRKEGP